MAKKKGTQKSLSPGKETVQVERVRNWLHAYQNWIYIAIIVFCLSVTALSKLSQYYGC